MSESNDQPASEGWIADLCPEKPTSSGTVAQPVRTPATLARAARKRLDLLAGETALLRSAWTRAVHAGTCKNLATRKGTLKSKPARSVAAFLRRTRQAAMFGPAVTVDDMLVRLSDAAERANDQARN